MSQGDKEKDQKTAKIKLDNKKFNSKASLKEMAKKVKAANKEPDPRKEEGKKGSKRGRPKKHDDE